jgi:hypothetical protein
MRDVAGRRGGVERAAAPPDQGGPTRRGVLRWAGIAGLASVGAAASGMLAGCAPPTGPGLVLPGVGGGLQLADGFTARLVAVAGRSVPGTGTEFRPFPDGAATFADPVVAGGWYLAVNHEVPLGGGVTSIRFAPDGTVTGARRLLSGTSLNCAGGATPWGTWLSCEEFDLGRVWECDPTGARPARPRPALGAFAHEAASVAADGRVYMTEDRSDGAFYRFTPDTPGDLSAGVLEVARGTAPGAVDWARVPSPAATGTLTRYQVPATMRFDGGEGIDTMGDSVWFTTKGDDRIWEYSLSSATVAVRYQGGGASILAGVDNLWVDEPSGALLVAEDGDDMQVVAVRPDDSTVVVAQVLGQRGSEVAGPCFSPDGSRLYFSSQRAPVGDTGLPLGATYEVSGPFGDLLGRP